MHCSKEAIKTMTVSVLSATLCVLVNTKVSLGNGTFSITRVGS
jgi:hypothetical protein